MSLYWVNFLASFDGEPEGEGDGEGSVTPATPSAPVAPKQPNQPQAGGDRNFNQEDLNRFLAEERRKTEAKMEAKYKEKLESLEQSYTDALTNKTLSDGERQQLEQQLEDLRARHRTKEQQLAYDHKVEREKLTSQIDEVSQKATIWEKRFTESTITRELQAAAVEHDAYNPEQIVVQLKNQTSLVEQMDASGKPTGDLVPMVRMLVKNDETGVSEQLQMTPSEAVEYMKKTPERWGNFFKNNIREGIGSSSATGGGLAGDGTVDVSRLTDEQYFELRKKNPAALGLKHLKPRQ